VAGLIMSTLALFTADLLEHARYGRCEGCERPSVAAVPGGAVPAHLERFARRAVAVRPTLALRWRVQARDLSGP
jgi:hypothetical protein